MCGQEESEDFEEGREVEPTFLSYFGRSFLSLSFSHSSLSHTLRSNHHRLALTKSITAAPQFAEGAPVDGQSHRCKDPPFLPPPSNTLNWL